MKKWRLALVVALVLSGCGGGALSLLTGGGPNVAANVQAGKTNTQTVGTTRITEQRVVRPQARTIEQSGDTRVRSENVRDVTVNEVPLWLAALLIVLAGLAFPSAPEIGRMIGRLFKR